MKLKTYHEAIPKIWLRVALIIATGICAVLTPISQAGASETEQSKIAQSTQGFSETHYTSTEEVDEALKNFFGD